MFPLFSFLLLPPSADSSSSCYWLFSCYTHRLCLQIVLWEVAGVLTWYVSDCCISCVVTLWHLCCAFVAEDHLLTCVCLSVQDARKARTNWAHCFVHWMTEQFLFVFNYLIYLFIHSSVYLLENRADLFLRCCLDYEQIWNLCLLSCLITSHTVSEP